MSSPSPPTAGVELRPFRGWTFDPGRVRIEDVLCPPYDVIEPDDDAALRERSARNIVRVVRPAAGGDAGPAYAQAGELLRSWCRDGTLRHDERPALYVYEQRHPAGRQLGIIGALELRDPVDGVIIPHEEVFPGPVADRLALMRATNAQLEPILVTCDGVDDVAPLLARVASTEPLLTAVPDDGTEHRLWRVGAVDDAREIQQALQSHSALIADGHHRYATYRQLQRERAGGDGGPCDSGLALLVGTDLGSLSLGPIHRTVRTAAMSSVVRATADGIDVEVLSGVDPSDPVGLLEMLASEPSGPLASVVEMIATDGREVVRLRCRPGSQEARDRLAAVVLAEVVLPRVFGVRDGDSTVEYHHDAGHAVAAARDGGVALLLPPPSLDEVRALAAAGVTMPRKSTSFGPKPRSGLVLRTLDG